MKVTLFLKKHVVTVGHLPARPASPMHMPMQSFTCSSHSERQSILVDQNERLAIRRWRFGPGRFRAEPLGVSLCGRVVHDMGAAVATLVKEWFCQLIFSRLP